MAASKDTSPSPSADDRDLTAVGGDATSDAHDQTSEARDERSDARDRRADTRENEASRFDPEAASDRAGAKRDRQSSAGDRTHALRDRQAASTDRSLAARERATSIIDGLTGAHYRAPGLVELDREIIKAKRVRQPFVLAFFDVDNLKAVNDAHGHLVGDEVLALIVSTIRRSVREYDLIVRYGGDEFLCGLLNVTLAEAANRFETAQTELAARPDVSFTVGLAELGPGDGLDDLIRRADVAMYQERERGTGDHA
ncbi:MAG TPA: GGDEF domain-containing protein [Frankiaceae bacterium]|nr:GGDEF domain-containing protein [Frankiaceae bacterium]